tara:strand:+ start:1149 stop:1565 length:417 start_codon:yes stop_codon:yes gene_type:complete
MADEFVEDDTGQPISTGYKFGHIVSEIENIFGRQSVSYLSKLVNDALLEIGAKRQKKVYSKKFTLSKDKRWYSLPAELIDITKIEILSTPSDASCSISDYTNQTDCESNGGTWTVPVGRYTMIPKLSDSHKLLKGDED